MNYTSRLAKLREKLTEKELEGILISSPENRYYMSGFDGTAGYLFITGDTAILATDFRYIERATSQAPDYEIVRIQGAMSKWLPDLINRLAVKNIAFESDHVTYSLYNQITGIFNENHIPTDLKASTDIVESIRVVKEPEELMLIEKASSISDEAFHIVEARLKEGMTEKQVAWELEKTMKELGSETLPFNIIVASGPNAALPHAQASDKPIQTGEPVVIDMGARVGGYGSDLSRTICIGQPDNTFKKIYGIILDSQQAAIKAIEEGMSGEQADSISRDIIEKAGYGETFGHSLGHGVGLIEHEQPLLGPNSTGILGNGMVFSLEPGIYISGWGGVRIEDLAVMENGRVKIISHANKII